MGTHLTTSTTNEAAGNHSWIRSLLSQLELLHSREEIEDPVKLWDDLEESTLLDRLRELPPLINLEAGYHLMHAQWFLPPQKTVCTFSVKKGSADYWMQLVLRQAGPTLIFYTKSSGVNTSFYGLYRYIAGDKSVHVKLRRVLRPAAVTDKDLQEWFGYLLSGFQESFTPTAT